MADRKSDFLRAAIVGCGKIADQHIHALRRIGGNEVVGACDREMLMAEQLCERFGIKGCFAELDLLLSELRPDVVHITTPPQSHFSLAKRCLESGAHVYLEKPFTVTAQEAEQLLELAHERNLKLTAGHNYQFTPEMLDMRLLIKSDFLGGKPTHLESHWSYSLDDPNYIGPVLGNPKHWVRQLPGQLFHNIISHGIAKLVEFLDEDIVHIHTLAYQSPRLKALGGAEVYDELRVLLQDRTGTTALFCFSTQFKPGVNQLRIFGEKNALLVDHGSGVIIPYRSQQAKSYLTFLLPPLRQAKAYFSGAARNFTNIVRGRLHQDSGVKELIDQFYTSIRRDSAVPIPYSQILLTARIMDEIFAQIQAAKLAPARIQTTMSQVYDKAKTVEVAT